MAGDQTAFTFHYDAGDTTTSVTPDVSQQMTAEQRLKTTSYGNEYKSPQHKV